MEEWEEKGKEDKQDEGGEEEERDPMLEGNWKGTVQREMWNEYVGRKKRPLSRFLFPSTILTSEDIEIFIYIDI